MLSNVKAKALNVRTLKAVGDIQWNHPLVVDKEVPSCAGKKNEDFSEV